MSENPETSVLRSLGPSFATGPCYYGQALDQTGQLVLFNSGSALSTTIQAGNATAAITYTLPTAGPAANNYVLGSSTVGVLSWINAAGTYAPIGSAFVTIGADATLTAERALTGTTNQIVVTDNGAGSTVVLSLPQSINTGAAVQFGTLGIGTSATHLVDIAGTANTNADIRLNLTNAGTGYALIETLNSGSSALARLGTAGTGATGNLFTSPTVAAADVSYIEFAGETNSAFMTNSMLTIATQGASKDISMRTNSTVRFTIADALITLAVVPKFGGTNSTGAGTALLGSNSPASTLTAPYTWINAQSSDGSVVYIPCWK